MSVKSKARMVGRKLRRITGISFPVAMKLGKIIARDDGVDKIHALKDKHYGAFSFESLPPGCDCCSGEYKLSGPKGSVQSFWISDSVIDREYQLMKKVS